MFQRPDRLDDTLYVVTSVFDPVRYRSRWKLYEDFKLHVEATGKAKLFTVEVAFGEREFAVTQPGDPWALQLRTTHELWLKENALNLAIQRLPTSAKYIAWVDADVHFVREDWADETLHQLQHYGCVQMWSQAQDMSSDHEIVQEHRSFCWCWWNDECLPTPPGWYGFKGRRWHWHPGFAWAIRREWLDWLGRLLDFAILGSADDHMAKALVGKAASNLHGKLSADYKRDVVAWEDRAAALKHNIGYVPGLLLHKWHGPKANRQYQTRWSILVQHDFNPRTDLRRDSQGLWTLAGNKPALRDDLQRYFRSRQEDALS